MKYLFVLGKNPELSITELNSYFRKESIDYDVIEKNKNFLVLELKETIPDIISHLGGTIKIVEIKRVLRKNEMIEDNLDGIIPGSKDKYFGLSLYPDSDPKTLHFRLAKKICMEVKARARMKFLPYVSRDMPEITHVEVIKRRLIDHSFDLVIGLGKKKYIGKTIQIHNPFEFQKRDMGRPRQRPMFSIPPRLAKIMINLSACRKNQSILDPFCGVGTILQEAILEGMPITGVDIDGEMVRYSQVNLKWLGKEYGLKKKWKIIQGDTTKLSTYLPEDSFDAVVSEPDLGPPIPKTISRSHAEMIIKDLVPMFRKSFIEFRKVLKPDGRVVLVFPSIRSDDGLVRMDTAFLDDLDCSVNSFQDSDPSHRLVREIKVVRI